MKLSGQKPKTEKPKMSVASAFNQDSDDEPEEMPREAKMRMRNIGRYNFLIVSFFRSFILFIFKEHSNLFWSQLLRQDETGFFRLEKGFREEPEGSHGECAQRRLIIRLSS